MLARLLGIEDREPFGSWGDRTIGVTGRLPEPIDRASLAARIEALLGSPSDVLPFGPELVERVAIVSGAAADLIPEVAAAGADAFVTGETSHTFFHPVTEHSLNVIYGGHYNTETVGLKALANKLASQFNVQTVFIDLPTGL